MFIPIHPLPKKRHRTTHGRTYSDPETVQYENTLAWLMRLQYKGVPVTTKVEATIIFYTKSRADTDNLVKAVLDAGNGVLWKDDRLVRDIITRKIPEYQTEGIDITIKDL